MEYEEIWSDVKGYEGIYEVSNYGSIRTDLNKVTHSNSHGVRHWKQRILKQKTDKKGYKRVSLWKNGKNKTLLVHRIVAISFLSPIPNKEYINHIDGNPSNNKLNNLEWCNHKDNLYHAYRNRLNQSPDPVILFNKETEETHHFLSKSNASKFLGKNKGYISMILKKGITSVGVFEIYTRQSKKETKGKTI